MEEVGKESFETSNAQDKEERDRNYEAKKQRQIELRTKSFNHKLASHSGQKMDTCRSFWLRNDDGNRDNYDNSIGSSYHSASSFSSKKSFRTNNETTQAIFF